MNKNKYLRFSGLRRKILATGAASLALSSAGALRAQPQARIYRIGILAPDSLEWRRPLVDVFIRAMRELGYVEGKNIIYEPRYASGDAARLSAFAAELAALNPDVIVAPNGVATAAAARATAAAKRQTPIVFAAWSDPVASGLVKSLAHPGGNVTGLSNTSVQLAGKQLQLLQTAFPKISRVAVFIDMETSTTAFFKEEVEGAAKALRLQTLFLEMRSNAVFENNVASIREWRADAIFVHNAPSNSFNRPLMVQIAEKTRLPAMYGNDLYTDIGGLMSYGSDDKLRWLQIATYVDKILKGTRAGDLPIDLPTKFDFVINLKTAKALGVAIPPSILARATKLIE